MIPEAPSVPDVAANLAQVPVESPAGAEPQEFVFDDVNAALASTLTPEEIAQFGGGVPEEASPALASQQPPAPAAPAPVAPTLSPEVLAIMEQNREAMLQMQALVQQQQAEAAALRAALTPKKEPPKRPAEFKSLEDYEAYLRDTLRREELSPLQQQVQQLTQTIQGLQRQHQVQQVDAETTQVVRGVLAQKFPKLDATKAAKVERTVKELAINMAMTYGARNVAEVAPLLNELLDDLADGRINSIQQQAVSAVRAPAQQVQRVPQPVRMAAPAAGLDLPEYSKSELTQAGYSTYMEASHDNFRRLPRK